MKQPFQTMTYNPSTQTRPLNAVMSPRGSHAQLLQNIGPLLFFLQNILPNLVDPWILFTWLTVNLLLFVRTFISQFNKDLQSSFILTNILNKDVEYLEKYTSETFILENGYQQEVFGTPKLSHTLQKFPICEQKMVLYGTSLLMDYVVLAQLLLGLKIVCLIISKCLVKKIINYHC